MLTVGDSKYTHNKSPEKVLKIDTILNNLEKPKEL